MNVAVHVQHHPSRAHLLPQLLDRLGCATVITDPDPDNRRKSALRTYLACLEACPPQASHLIVVQDDAYPCDHFRERAEEAIAERPDHLVALYAGGAPARTAQWCRDAHKRGERWVDRHPADRYTNTVCLAWPVQFIEGFPSFAASRRWSTGGDDNVVGSYVLEHGLPVSIRVPSLVQHPDTEPSLFGKRPSAGRNRYRVAAVFESSL